MHGRLEEVHARAGGDRSAPASSGVRECWALKGQRHAGTTRNQASLWRPGPCAASTAVVCLVLAVGPSKPCAPSTSLQDNCQAETDDAYGVFVVPGFGRSGIAISHATKCQNAKIVAYQNAVSQGSVESHASCTTQALHSLSTYYSQATMPSARAHASAIGHHYTSLIRQRLQNKLMVYCFLQDSPAQAWHSQKTPVAKRGHRGFLAAGGQQPGCSPVSQHLSGMPAERTALVCTMATRSSSAFAPWGGEATNTHMHTVRHLCRGRLAQASAHSTLTSKPRGDGGGQ